MDRQKCHCNGSRGTDCDWCGGSGWKSVPIRLNTEPLIKPPKKEEPKTDKPQPRIEDPKSDRKTFDERIQELNSSLKISSKNLSDDAKQYLQKRINDLYSDIIRLENRVTKKRRKHYEKIKSQSAQLIKDFEQKFQKKNLPKIRNIEATSKKIFVKKIDEPIIKSHKKKKINQPTLVNKFKDLFDTLKQRLKQYNKRHSAMLAETFHLIISNSIYLPFIIQLTNQECQHSRKLEPLYASLHGRFTFEKQLLMLGKYNAESLLNEKYK